MSEAFNTIENVTVCVMLAHVKLPDRMRILPMWADMMLPECCAVQVALLGTIGTMMTRQDGLLPIDALPTAVMPLMVSSPAVSKSLDRMASTGGGQEHRK